MNTVSLKPDTAGTRWYTLDMLAMLLVFSAMLAAAACEAPSQPSRVAIARPRADLDAVAFSGRAIDYATGAGVPNVSVEIGTEFFPSLIAEARTTTDATGSYTLAIRPGSYFAAVNGVFAGSIHVTSAGSRGDFLTRPGTCVSRYGVIADPQTRRPLSGARVQLAGQTVTSGADGWYRVDLGCPANGLIGFNTTLISFSRPDYVSTCIPVGRGVSSVDRLDVFLGRRNAFVECPEP